MTGKHHQETEDHEVVEPLIVRDRRKIDPDTGEARPAIVDEAGEPGPSLGESMVDEAVTVTSDVEKELAERTADLQRLQAEYANYRKRVERDRAAVVAAGQAPERAERHGDLTGAFRAVADKLVAGLQRVGLEPFGDEGEPFDPSVHEAVQHDTSPDVSGPTVTSVLRRGYRLGERVLRAALVGVTDHEPGAAPAAEVVDEPVEGELPIDSNENAG